MTYRLRDRDLWDVLAALCLDALVIFAWSTTYAGAGWWVAALVAALFSVCVVVVVRDMGGNPVFVPGVLLVAYVVCAGPLAAGTLAARGTNTFTDGLAATGESGGNCSAPTRRSTPAGRCSSRPCSCRSSSPVSRPRWPSGRAVRPRRWCRPD